MLGKHVTALPLTPLIESCLCLVPCIDGQPDNMVARKREHTGVKRVDN